MTAQTCTRLGAGVLGALALLATSADILAHPRVVRGVPLYTNLVPAAPRPAPMDPTADQPIAVDPTEEYLSLERNYSARLPNGYLVRLSSRRFLGKRSVYYGSMEQPDGRRVSFDPKAVADRVIVPALVPEIEALVRQVQAIDAEPTELVDRNGGGRWRRVE